MLNPASILIIKPSSLGDVVHTLPAVALVKKRWPGARLRWLVNPEWAPLLAGNPHIDEVVIFPRGEFRGVGGWKKIVPWARAMAAAQKSELVLDFQGLLRSALVAKLCRGGNVFGLSDAREGSRFFYDRTIDVSGATHAVDRYLALVRALGIDTTGELAWPLPAGEPVAGIEPGFILLHPFSRGAGKSLSREDVLAFCRAAAPRRLVVAGRADVEIEPCENATNLLNATSIAQLIWLIRQAAFVVSVDSGPMHIAAAITGRLVSIHTWSDPEKVGPYRRDAWIWQRGQLFHRGEASASRPAASIEELAAFVAREIDSTAARARGAAI